MAHLGSALVLVLGHERCGAVAAAVAGAKQPGHIDAVLAAIEPAVKKTKGQAGDPVENAVRAQALDVAKQLQEAKPILAKRVEVRGAQDRCRTLRSGHRQNRFAFSLRLTFSVRRSAFGGATKQTISISVHFE